MIHIACKHTGIAGRPCDVDCGLTVGLATVEFDHSIHHNTRVMYDVPKLYRPQADDVVVVRRKDVINL